MAAPTRDAGDLRAIPDNVSPEVHGGTIAAGYQTVTAGDDGRTHLAGLSIGVPLDEARRAAGHPSRARGGV